MTVASQVKGCFASVKSAQAALNMLENKTQSDEAKHAFAEASKIMEAVKSDLENQIITLSQEEPQYKS